MLEKIAKLQILTVGLLVTITILLCTQIISKTISKSEITVTGSAFEIVKSDSGSLDFDIVVKKATKKESLTEAQKELEIVKEYLINKKIQNSDIEIKTVHGYYTYKRDLKTGNYTDIPELYNLSQPIKISSNNVELIKELSTDITKLINKGVDIEVSAPSYGYSKLGDLKVSLLEKASSDAKARATSMLKPTKNSVGSVNSVRMGVYQITPVNSNEVSDYGISDTSSIDKKVTAVANISFKIK